MNDNDNNNNDDDDDDDYGDVNDVTDHRSSDVLASVSGFIFSGECLFFSKLDLSVNFGNNDPLEYPDLFR